MDIETFGSGWFPSSSQSISLQRLKKGWFCGTPDATEKRAPYHPVRAVARSLGYMRGTLAAKRAYVRHSH